jgi:hypothetical protein
MSLLDELKREAARSTPLDAKRAQIEALCAKTQAAFKEQFLLDAANTEQIAFLKGRMAAFEECLQLFVTEEEQEVAQEGVRWAEDDL